MNVSTSSALPATFRAVHRYYRIANLAFSVALAGSALLSAGAASAQSNFNAKIIGHVTPHAFCEVGVNLCGVATIAGFVAPAEYRFIVTSVGLPSRSCGSLTAWLDYGATVTFTLPDASKLTLNESGTACYPGKSFPTGGLSFGNPRTLFANWTVQSALGEFSGTTGSGTDTALFAGGVIRFTYTAGQ